MLFCLLCCPWWFSQALESEQAALLQHLWALMCHKAGRWSSAVLPAVPERSPEGAAPHPDVWARLLGSFLSSLPSLVFRKENKILAITAVRVHFRVLQPLEVKRCSQYGPYPMGCPSVLNYWVKPIHWGWFWTCWCRYPCMLEEQPPRPTAFLGCEWMLHPAKPSVATSKSPST